MTTPVRRSVRVPSRVAILTWLALAPGLAPSAAAQFEFTGLRTTPPPGQTVVMDWAFGDVDEDGDLDAVHSRALWTDPHLLLGVSGGAFQPGVLMVPGFGPHTGPAGVGDLALADMDGDGHLDLVGATNGQGAGWIRVGLGNGDGTFAPSVATMLTGLSTTIEVADFTGDGVLDAVCLAHGFLQTPAFELATGRGDGTFDVAPLPGTLGTLPFMLSGDLDADGDTDLLLTTLAGGAPAWTTYLADGAGGFDLVTHDAADLAEVGWMRVADLDGDGILDLVWERRVKPWLYAPTAVDLVVQAGVGDGTFLAPQSVLDVDSRPGAVGDFDGDDVPDLALVVGDELWVLRGDGALGFTVDLVLADAPVNGDVLIADADGDGRDDLLVPVVDGGIAVAHGRNYQAAEPFEDLGFELGLTGADDAPRLWADGDYQPGTTQRFVLEDAPTSGDAWLLAGTVRLDMPLSGGTVVPAPEAVLGPIPLDGSGELVLEGTWPTDLAELPDLWFQLWVETPAAPLGAISTNAVRASESLRD